MSLAGGTGSGLGTHVTEMLRDLYSKAFIVNQVVAPYPSGEVIVQNYNSLLTLAHLYQVCTSYAHTGTCSYLACELLFHVCIVNATW